MTRNSDEELLTLLALVSEGGDPTALVPRIRELVAMASPEPWLRELEYVARHFTPDESATTDAFVAVAKIAVTRYPCPVCGQVILDKPAWHGGSPSHEI